MRKENCDLEYSVGKIIYCQLKMMKIKKTNRHSGYQDSLLPL